jgi:hypothetical protein
MVSTLNPCDGLHLVVVHGLTVLGHWPGTKLSEAGGTCGLISPCAPRCVFGPGQGSNTGEIN